jgi:hypothetical protein
MFRTLTLTLTVTRDPRSATPVPRSSPGKTNVELLLIVLQDLCL